MIASCIALALAFALDIAAVGLLIEASSALTAPAGFLVLHAAASTLAACALPRLLPRPYRQTPGAVALFCWMLTLCTPVLGLTGLTAAMVPAFWKQRTYARRHDWLRADLTLPLGSNGVEDASGLKRLDRCLVGVLMCAPQHSSRARALIATLPLDALRAVPLLRIGLLDRDDEVRLLAYSLLTRKEKSFEERISKARCLLDHGKPEEARTAHQSLAYDYWELAALCSAGSSKSFFLEQAQRHAEAAVMLQPADASLQLLLGRVLLKQSKLEAARVTLLRAVASGASLHKVTPFLAEVAFHRGEFRRIGLLLNMEQGGSHGCPVPSLRTYWQEPCHGR